MHDPLTQTEKFRWICLEFGEQPEQTNTEILIVTAWDFSIHARFVHDKLNMRLIDLKETGIILRGEEGRMWKNDEKFRRMLCTCQTPEKQVEEFQ